MHVIKTQLLNRCKISLFALTIFVLIGCFQSVDYSLYYRFTYFIDGEPALRPFIDLYAVLQASKCWIQGVNVYLPSVCMAGGVFNYSPMLLEISYFGFGPQHTVLIGLIIEIAFLFSLSLLPAPITRTEFFFRTATIISTTTFYAMERANFDIIIFLIVILVLSLPQRYFLSRAVGYVSFLFMAALKFYPLFLLVLAAREKLWRLILLTILVLAFGIFYVIYSFNGVDSALKIIPHGSPFGEYFGSINLPLGIYLLLNPRAAFSIAAIFNSHLPKTQTTIFHCLEFMAIIPVFFFSPRYDQTLKTMDDIRRVYLLAGAVLIVGCFFVAQNADYRGIFIFLTLPGLYHMAQTGNREERAKIFSIMMTIPLLLSEPLIRHLTFDFLTEFFGLSVASFTQITLWFTREFLWWWLVIQLSAILVAFFKIEIMRLFIKLNCVIKQVDESGPIHLNK